MQREREERGKKKKELVVQVLQLVRLLPPSPLCAVPLIARNVFNPPSFSRKRGEEEKKKKNNTCDNEQACREGKKRRNGIVVRREK